MRAVAYAMLVALLFHGPLVRGAGDTLSTSEQVRQGSSRFRTSCALCHGLHAQGGARGPDLTRGVWNHGGSDADLRRTITQGVPGTLMAGHELSDSEVRNVIAFLRSVSSRLPTEQGGDAQAGKALFHGRLGCDRCHMVDGAGGRLGPDLSHIGSARSPGYLATKLRTGGVLATGLYPEGTEWPVPYETVSVTVANGERIVGALRNEDAFSIQFMDSSGNLRSFLKSEVSSVTHEEMRLMPVFGTDSLSDSQLRDLLAYLGSLRAARGAP